MGHKEERRKVVLFPEHTDASSIDVADIYGDYIKREVRHRARGIIDHAKSEESILKERSITMHIDGAWGWGKTTVAHAFVNEIKKQKTIKIVDLTYELLPFSNVNESISYILTDIAKCLLNKNLADVRRQMKSLIADATPTLEGNATLKLGPLSLTHPYSYQSVQSGEHKRTLGNKLRKLVNEDYLFVVLIDDLDRLRPDEMVAVLRMVESFADVPGFLFILPFYKEVVVNAMKTSLSLDANHAQAFLRKFRDLEIVITYYLNDLQGKFVNEFECYQKKDFRKVKGFYGIEASELAWNILKHFIVVRSAVDGMGPKPDGNTLVDWYPNYEVSSYLDSIQRTLLTSRNDRSGQPFLMETDGEKRWAPASELYLELALPLESPSGAYDKLRQLLRIDHLMKYVYSSSELTRKWEKKSLNWDEDVEKNADKKVFFHAMLLDLLRTGTHEPLITKYYGMRDMVQLAQSIASDEDIKPSARPGNILRSFIQIIDRRFEEFR